MAGASDVGAMADAVEVNRGVLDDMRPAPFQNGEWLTVREVFAFCVSGIQTKRDNFVYGISRQQVTNKINAFIGLDRETRGATEEAARIFHDSRDRQWAAAHAVEFDEEVISAVCYRPMDNRFLYNHRAYGDF